MNPRILLTSCAVLLAAMQSSVEAQLIISPSMTFVQEGGAIGIGNIGTTGTAFALDLIAGGAFAPTHTIPNVNNGTFGNASSWIGDSANSYVGIGFGSPQTIAGFAFGRDNTGGFGDRAVGLYTVQITTSPNPALNHATATWITVGTINLAAGSVVSNPALRHQYNINSPVNATALRLITPGGAAIDELELFTTPAPGGIAGLVTHSSPGFTVGWDGNDGAHFSASGTTVPNNLALATNGAVPFSSSDLGPEIGLPFHRAINLNDGRYGNANSWIGGDGAAGPFHAGVMLGGLFDVTSIAWGRDNGLDEPSGDCCGGQLRDRSMGIYTIQRTLDGNNWETVGTVDYNYGTDDVTGDGFTPYLRHEFTLSDGDGGITAMGMRILVPSTGLNGGTAIDEIEVFGTPVPEPGSALLLLGGIATLAARRRRPA